MNDQSLNNEPLDRREARRQRRTNRQSSGGAWITGMILIVLGGAFLMQNMGRLTIPLTNWWALFILIPAVGAFGNALHTYHNADNHLTASARGSLLVGLILTIVTIAFLFSLTWTYLGPALIILAGIGILINAMLPGESS